MADKKITELQLRDDVDATVNFPIDDGTQSYRVTAPQIKDFVLDVDITFLDDSDDGYTLLSSDKIVECDATGGDFDVDLPAASVLAGKKVIIQKTDTTSNEVTITGTISGATDITLVKKGDLIEIYSNGTTYEFIKSGNSSEVEFGSVNGFGAVDDYVRNFDTTPVDIGSALTPLTTANNGSKITVNQKGRYYIKYDSDSSTSNGVFYITKNSTTLTSDIGNGDPEVIAWYYGAVANSVGFQTVVIIDLEIGDIIRFQSARAGSTNDDPSTKAFMKKIG